MKAGDTIERALNVIPVQLQIPFNGLGDVLVIVDDQDMCSDMG
jgi:hypothetical protein